MALAVSVVTLPLMIHYLGRVEYGVWVTVSTTVVMLAVLDLGISSTLVNFIAKAYANDDPEIARQYYSTAFWITTLVSIAMIAVFAVIWRWINWGALFGLHDAILTTQASHCVIVSLGFFLLNLPLSLASKVLSGYQKIQVANYFSMINSVLGLIAIVGGILAHLSIVGLMISFCFAMLTGTLLLNAWLSFVSHPWIRPRFSAIRLNMTKELFGEGLLFFVLQIAGLVVFNSDNLVIMHYCGAGQVTPYSVTWRLMSYASMLHGLLIPVLWPAFADAYHRKDLRWVRVNYQRFMRATMAGVCIIAITLAVLGRWIIRIWATDAAVPSQGLLWAMCLWAIVLSLTTNQACLLAATQRVSLQALTSSMAAVLNLVLSIILVQHIGPIGAILATLISYLIFIVLPQHWEVRNILHGRYMSVPDAT
jgi:O-antigen/teichoic acid export membrane protein